MRRILIWGICAGICWLAAWKLLEIVRWAL